jgi:abortive infection bacteriophage resistance protein
MKTVEEICNNREEAFLEHYYKKYDRPGFPPAWMIIQCVSFGTLRQILSNFRLIGDKKKVCKIFKKPPFIIESWLECLRYTRNICAHHGRLWNRWFVFSPKRDRNINIACLAHTFCEQAYIILSLLQDIDIKKCKQWNTDLYQLFEKYPQVPFRKMGFNQSWKQDPFWKRLLD